MQTQDFEQLQKFASTAVLPELLSHLSVLFPEKTVFSTGFGEEDQLLTHYIFSQRLPINVFTLDTGRIFPETYTTWQQTLERYKQPIIACYPKFQAVEHLLLTKGPTSFYESLENRKECCFIRKVEPLQRALEGKDCWITGIRAEHSQNRQTMNVVEWDSTYQLIKVNPLLHWTTEQVRQEIFQYNIPTNPLHKRGFASIGCQPCTRAIQPGEDQRAGRWWWEMDGKKECGL